MSERTPAGTPGASASGVPGRTRQDPLPDMPPVVSGRPLGTRGAVEIAVTCPRCARVHRHRGPGLRTGPCRLAYIVRIRPGGTL